MTSQLKITAVGNSMGVILPKDVLERLRVKKGDLVYVHETSNGVELSAYNEEFSKQMDLADGVMREYRDVLKKLAE